MGEGIEGVDGDWGVLWDVGVGEKRGMEYGRKDKCVERECGGVGDRVGEKGGRVGVRK